MLGGGGDGASYLDKVRITGDFFKGDIHRREASRVAPSNKGECELVPDLWLEWDAPVIVFHHPRKLPVTDAPVITVAFRDWPNIGLQRARALSEGEASLHHHACSFVISSSALI